jgi:hypothetical protein
MPTFFKIFRLEPDQRHWDDCQSLRYYLQMILPIFLTILVCACQIMLPVSLEGLPRRHITTATKFSNLYIALVKFS